ncbi:MAG: hypothetical protein ABR591_01830 [Candidatus Velthaea sp.]
MKAPFWPAAVALSCAVPARVALMGEALDAVAGAHVRAFDARIFAGLGVTQNSPLPVRQAWFAGVYLLLPLAGCAAAFTCAAAGGKRVLFRTLAAVNLTAVAAAAIASLLDD